MARIVHKSIVILTALPLLLAGCPDSASEVPAGAPMKELLAAGVSPIEIGGIARSIGPIPAFRASIKNLSSSPVSAVNWTAVFLDEQGGPVGGPVDGGYSDSIDPIGPGQTIDGHLPAPSDAVRSVRVVIKGIIYKIPNPSKYSYGELPAKWENPHYEAELAAAQGH